MTLLQWSKGQLWWPHVHSLIRAGLNVLLHVPEAPPMVERFLRHAPSGGVLVVEHCDSSVWHIVCAAPTDVLSELSREHDPTRLAGTIRGWQHVESVDE